MRAFGLALAPSLLLVGIADLLVVGAQVEPELWLALIGLAVFSALVHLPVSEKRIRLAAAPA